MNDVHSTFYDALVAASLDAGQALYGLKNRIHRDILDMPSGTAIKFPLLALQVGEARPLDVAKGSRWDVHEGTILLHLVEAVGTGADKDAAARRACEDRDGNLRRVLKTLRAVTSSDYPAGVWSEMTFAPAGGGAGTFDGRDAYMKRTACAFRFRRLRSAP